MELEENISHPHYSNIIVEEPELNLFPETQKDLIYDLLEMINSGRDHLLMTTHSPYLLYALNNCMAGGFGTRKYTGRRGGITKMKDSLSSRRMFLYGRLKMENFFLIKRIRTILFKMKED